VVYEACGTLSVLDYYTDTVSLLNIIALMHYRHLNNLARVQKVYDMEIKDHIHLGGCH